MPLCEKAFEIWHSDIVIAHPRLRTLHCLAKLLNDHLPIYETTHFFKWESADQNFKKRASLQCQCIEHESTIWQLYFTFPFWRQDYHFTWSSSDVATQRTSHLQSKGKTFISWTLSVYWPDPEGSKPRHSCSAVKRSTDWASPAALS